MNLFQNAWQIEWEMERFTLKNHLFSISVLKILVNFLRKQNIDNIFLSMYENSILEKILTIFILYVFA